MPAGDAPRVLSVEDNPETRLRLEHLLEDSCNVAFASGVEEALGAVEGEEFDLLLLDINLGSKQERGGVELLRLIRKREDVGPVPAIAVTAFAMPGDREPLLREGFDDYVGKPFTGAELLEAVDRVLGSG